jgi:hypothetical protein
MVKTLEERKKELVSWCKEAYADKPLKKCHYREIEYKTTLETATYFKTNQQILDSFSIKLNFHMQLFVIIILCFFAGYGYWLTSKSDSFKPMIIFGLFFLAALVLLIIKIFDRKPKIILNKEGFWIHKMDEQIPWEYLAASYILKDHSGDDAKYSLVVHYYQKQIDDFVRVEYDLEGLEMGMEDISFHIEKFKEKNIYNVRE